MPARELLLVDDDEYTRLVHRRFLPSPPFSIETAANGQAAIEAMARRWPQYLLVDMEMPVRNGIDTVRWVREREAAQALPRCHVVMLSGNDDPAAVSTALQAGADRFLTKPVSREALLSTLRELEFGVAEPPALQVAQEEPAAPRGPDLPSTAADEVVTVDPEWMEFFPGFVRLQQETVEGMAHALASGDRDGVHFLAHRASGGLGSMGLLWASRQARIVELDAHQASSKALSQRVVALREHLKKVRIEPAGVPVK
jgi:CheY-like chemotaxis protein